MNKLEDYNPPTLHPSPSTALTRLATLVPHEARRPIYFHPGSARSWRSRGASQKQLATDVKRACENRHNDTLALFCQGSKPNYREGSPTRIASCIASWQRKSGTGRKKPRHKHKALRTRHTVRSNPVGRQLPPRFSPNHGRLSTQRNLTNRRLNREGLPQITHAATNSSITSRLLLQTF
jgi:hypothetical protein